MYCFIKRLRTSKLSQVGKCTADLLVFDDFVRLKTNSVEHTVAIVIDVLTSTLYIFEEVYGRPDLDVRRSIA